MPIFKITENKKLSKVEEKRFDLEKDLQKLTEENLKEIFGLDFIYGSLNKQLVIQNFELDTLAFDPDAKSFVIIEYKNDKSFSVIDQGFNYLSLMLNNKAEFILGYNEGKKANLKKDDIDWSQSRVIFVAPSFTPYQKGAIAFKDLPIELWEVTLWKDNLILYNQLKPPEVSESIQKVTKNKTIANVSKEIKTYTLDDHLSKANNEIINLFYKFREKIFELDSRIQEKPVSWYIAYRIKYHNFCSISFYKQKLRLFIRAKSIDDPRVKFKTVPSKWGWGKTPLWQGDLTKETEIDYTMNIVKQGYEAAPDK